MKQMVHNQTNVDEHLICLRVGKGGFLPVQTHRVKFIGQAYEFGYMNGLIGLNIVQTLMRQ